MRRLLPWLTPLTRCGKRYSVDGFKVGGKRMEEIKVHRAVVTGATGAVGTALCCCLLVQGAEVFAVVNPASRRVGNLPEGTRIIRCDIGDMPRLPELIGSPVDAFFHLAWRYPIGPGRNDALAQTDNIRCAVEAVRVAKALGCQVFVGAGSQAEYGPTTAPITPDTPCFPVNGYGIAKLCAGQMTRLECKRLGLRHCWARILSVYGPHDGEMSVLPTIIQMLLKGEKPALTPGEQQWDFLYADDAGRALIAMAERGRDGAVYPVGSGQTRRLRDYFIAVRDAIDPALPLGLGELPYPPNQQMFLQADLTAITQDTGFVPRVSFEEGIRLTIDAFRQQE